MKKKQSIKEYITEGLQQAGVKFTLTLETVETIHVESNPSMAFYNFYDEQWELSIEGFATGPLFHTVEIPIERLLEIAIKIATQDYEKVKDSPTGDVSLVVETSFGTQRFTKEK